MREPGFGATGGPARLARAVRHFGSRARTALGAVILLGAIGLAWHLRQADAEFGTCVPGFGATGKEGGWQNAGAPEAPAWEHDFGAGNAQSGHAHVLDNGTLRYDVALLSPPFVVPARGARLEFRQRRAYSWANTMGVLEIAIADGPFADIETAGGTFLDGAYDSRSLSGNPLGIRPAWAAAPEADTLTRIGLPAAANGRPARLRFRLGSAGTGDVQPGWYLDGIRCAPE